MSRDLSKGISQHNLLNALKSRNVFQPGFVPSDHERNNKLLNNYIN